MYLKHLQQLWRLRLMSQRLVLRKRGLRLRRSECCVEFYSEYLLLQVYCLLRERDVRSVRNQRVSKLR